MRHRRPSRVPDELKLIGAAFAVLWLGSLLTGAATAGVTFYAAGKLAEIPNALAAKAARSLDAAQRNARDIIGAAWLGFYEPQEEAVLNAWKALTIVATAPVELAQRAWSEFRELHDPEGKLPEEAPPQLFGGFTGRGATGRWD